MTKPKLPLWGVDLHAMYGGGLVVVAAANADQAIATVLKERPSDFGAFGAYDKPKDPYRIGTSLRLRPGIVAEFSYAE